MQNQAVDGLQFWVSAQAHDPVWDAFLERTPGGHYRQSSLWAQLKAHAGWQVTRLVVTRAEAIIAGAQMLTRPLPLFGQLGYISKGPLVGSNDLHLSRLVVDALHQLARLHNVAYLVLQPAENGLVLERQLPDWGFRSSPKVRMPTTTTHIDLSQDIDVLMAKMRKSTRANIRRGQTRGILVREGTRDDLDIYYRLLLEASQRKQFEIYSKKYYSRLWESMDTGNYIKLFIAEFNAEPVSALYTIAFGDTIYTHTSAWSGRLSERKPNEVLEWSAVLWAKKHGYCFYDFEGIESEAALNFQQGESRLDPPNWKSDIWVTDYKLGFGGQVISLPGAYDYVYNPLLSWTYRQALPKVEHWPIVAKVVKTVVRTTQPQLS
jgi:lipid II:glycine glycyltransferase (peptidoglycan interpeptide bridge formation enzyme)